MQIGGTGGLELEFEIPNPPPPDVIYEIQVCDNLDEGNWLTVSRKVGRNLWEGPAHVSSDVPAGSGRVQIRAEDIYPTPGLPTRFMRLKVSILQE